MPKLSGKIAVVTGGTGGLGRFVVENFLEEGANVIVTHTGNAQSIKYLEDIKQKFKNISGESVNVTLEDEVNLFYERIVSTHGRIDILCNLVGGVGEKRGIEDITLGEWNTMLLLNLTSCFLMMRKAVSIMKKNGWGRVVSITAMPAITPEAKRGGYGVAKSGVITLTKTVAAEVKDFGNITVNAIAPSIILTEENKKWGNEEDFRKWVTPQQIAEMIVHLCSDSGMAMNGQVIQMYGKV